MYSNNNHAYTVYISRNLCTGILVSPFQYLYPLPHLYFHTNEIRFRLLLNFVLYCWMAARYFASSWFFFSLFDFFFSLRCQIRHADTTQCWESGRKSRGVCCGGGRWIIMMTKNRILSRWMAGQNNNFNKIREIVIVICVYREQDEWLGGGWLCRGKIKSQTFVWSGKSTLNRAINGNAQVGSFGNFLRRIFVS